MTKKRSEPTRSIAVVEATVKTTGSLCASDHAVKRFMQRGGLESLRVAGVNRSTTLLVRLCYVAMRLKTTQERVWDTTANKPVLLLRLPPLTLVAGLGLSIVESDELSDLVALIREEMIVTVLTLTMVANNKEVGMYFKPDQTPFPEHMTKRHRDFAKRMQDARKKKK